MAAMMACRPPWRPRGGRDPPSFTPAGEELPDRVTVVGRSTVSR